VDASQRTTPAARRPRPQRWTRRLLFFVATRLGWLVVLLFGFSTRIRIVGEARAQRLRSRYPILACIWHGRVFVPLFLYRYQRIHVMVSEHRDGEMMARTLHRLGYQTARGSSTRGGRRATLEIIHRLQPGNVAAIMPDGPQGPRHECKLGPLVIGQRTGAVLLPVTFSCSRKVHFKSWDRFILPLPFSTSIMLYGEPMTVPPDAQSDDLERLRQEFERRMVELERLADEYFAAP
jgi:lysophospholipid acyltransferase (LPLAT)-like uncharacterized protein